jgi:hypothetical protein
MRSVSPLTLLSLLCLLVGCAPEGSSAYVTKNLSVNSDCTAQSDDLGLPTGKWDVGGMDAETGDNCINSYFMNLLVNSNLKSNANDSTGRAEPNVLLITFADIRLMDKNQATLVFRLKDGTIDPKLPNPYRVRTASSLDPSTSNVAQSAIVPIEAIPKAYSPRLSAVYAGDSILLEITVGGTTTGNVEVDFRPFLFPVAICSGCLSRCANSFASEKDIATLTGSKCNDNFAQDGRYCIDPDCK